MIPKIIHYCWFGKKPFPKLVRKCIVTWQQHLPDYEFCLWNEENSPMNVPFIQQAYAAKKYAFVSDYVRFWALYNQGGIYLDTDMFVLRSFNDLSNNECFFGWHDAHRDFISCGVIACNANDELIRRIKEKYESLHFNSENLSEIIVPRLITPIYEQYEQKKKVEIYDYDYFYPFPYSEKENVGNFMKYATENTYAVHLWNVGWGTWQAKLRDRVFYYLRKLRGK